MKRHEKLPLKIVLVHNGEIKLNVKDTFDGFINKEFPSNGNIEFDRWDISTLTKLFSEKLFGAFLLTDSETTKLFNKVLINLDASEDVSENFVQLLDNIFLRIDKKQFNKKIPRKWIVLFESLHLISFMLYTESKAYNNLSIAKKYISFLVIRFWFWILKNELESNKKITKYFDKILNFYFHVLSDFFKRTLPIAQLTDGLFSEKGGRYEQIGYTCRIFDYLQDLCFYLNFLICSTVDDIERGKIKQIVINVIDANNVSIRPLLDIHLLPIVNILLLFLDNNDEVNAKLYLNQIFNNIKHAKEKYNRLPDANNDIRNVIKYIATYEKPVYYSDSTSTLLAVLMEFTVILDDDNLYYLMRDFINKNEIDIATFVPHHGVNSKSKHLIEDLENDLEEQLFSKHFFCDGYQHNLILKKDFTEDLNFIDYKKLIYSLKSEFSYEYRTDKVGYPFLKDLAHIYFKTPYFPDRWRIYLH